MVNQLVLLLPILVRFSITCHNFVLLCNGIISFPVFGRRSQYFRTLVFLHSHDRISSSEPSGLLLYTRNAKLHDDIKRTAMRSFRKSKEPYLTF